jgi:hypothetical protein
MNRRDFLKCVGADAVLGVPAGCMKTGAQTSAAKPKKPNVLFILTDDQREDTIGALGNPHIKCPTSISWSGRALHSPTPIVWVATQGRYASPAKICC